MHFNTNRYYLSLSLRVCIVGWLFSLKKTLQYTVSEKKKTTKNGSPQQKCDTRTEEIASND